MTEKLKERPRRFKKVAEVALAASPQDLEQLGWVVPS